MSAAKPRWPKPRIWEKKAVVSRWEANCMVAQILGLPLPERPAVDELLTARELAAILKVAPSTVVLRLRQARQAAADSPDHVAA
jgi:DNA-directed RNA polymerase specialized sigma24 family protein